MPVAVPLAAAAVTAGASIYSSKKQAKGIKDAQQASQAGADLIRADLSPFREAGVGALGRISNPNDVLKNFMASPDYDYRKGQAMDAVTTNRAVNGLLRSGSALKGVTGVASNLASSEFGNWWNRQSGLAQMGQNAAAQNAGAIQSNAENQGNGAIAAGNNSAGLAGGLATSITDLIAKYSGSSAPGGTSSYTPAPASVEGLY